MPKSFTLEDLTDEECAQVEKDLSQAVTNFQSASADRTRLRKEWRRIYHGEVKDKPYEWMSNVDMHLAQYMVDGAAKKLAGAVFGPDPLVEVVPTSPDGEEDAAALQNFLQYCYQRMRIRTKGFLALQWGQIDGDAWIWPRPRETRKKIPKGNDPVAINDLDVFPDLDYVLADEQMLFPFEAANFRQARGAFARQWMRWADIKKMRAAEQCYEKGADRLKSKWSQTNVPTDEQRYEGVGTTDPNDPGDSLFECWEGFYRWTHPEEEDERIYLMTFFCPTNQGDTTVVLLKMVEYTQYYDDLYFFVPILANAVPKSMHGTSTVDKIAGFHEWTNTTFNQVTDAITMSVFPARAAGLTAQGKNLQTEPGAIWPVQPSDVQEIRGDPNTARLANTAMTMVEDVRSQAARVTSVEDPSIGKIAPGNQTKFEIQAVLHTADQQQEECITTLQIGLDEDQGFKAVAAVIFQIMKKFFPKRPIMYRSPKASKDQPFVTINPSVFERDYDFIPTGSSTSSSAEVKFAKAQAELEQAQTSEFCMVSPVMTRDQVLDVMKRRWKALSKYFSAIGEQHPENVIGGEPADVDTAMVIAMVAFREAVNAIYQREAAKEQAGGNPASGMVQPAGSEGPQPTGTGPGQGMAGGEVPQGVGGVPSIAGSARLAQVAGTGGGNGAVLGGSAG